MSLCSTHLDRPSLVTVVEFFAHHGGGVFVHYALWAREGEHFTAEPILQLHYPEQLCHRVLVMRETASGNAKCKRKLLYKSA